jgi:hypothetical protein
MSRKLASLTELERKQLNRSIGNIAFILLEKMDETVAEQCIKGRLDVDGEEREVVFEIIARKKDSINPIPANR